jgi:hypothetical protein
MAGCCCEAEGAGEVDKFAMNSIKKGKVAWNGSYIPILNQLCTVFPSRISSICDLSLNDWLVSFNMIEQSTLILEQSRNYKLLWILGSSISSISVPMTFQSLVRFCCLRRDDPNPNRIAVSFLSLCSRAMLEPTLDPVFSMFAEVFSKLAGAVNNGRGNSSDFEYVSGRLDELDSAVARELGWEP